MDLMEVVRTSGTCRYYTAEDVPADVLARVLDATRWAPTGGNRQGLRFIAVRDVAKRRQLAEWYRETWTPYAARSRAGLWRIDGRDERCPSIRPQLLRSWRSRRGRWSTGKMSLRALWRGDSEIE